MNINNNTIINVCSFMPSQIIATSNVQDYVFEPCESMDAPIIVPMSAIELKNIHSRSHIFTDGYLTFEDDAKKDVYEYLKISNWQDILTQEDIKDIILNSTKEKLQKIIDIKSIGCFERVRGMYIALKQEKQDISLRVVEVIEARHKELLRGKFNSAIELRGINLQPNKDDNNELKQQLAEKDKALQELSEKMARLEAMLTGMNDSATTTNENNKSDGDKPKRGRPPKNK